ncbi:RICIN domain-containing protein [Streptomyces sp. SPB162]|uniref:RICIN domain-containing protein n=1 Tax=Streptomyces sp. SPB162 TaxID=2940560 RepID=UPI002405AF61|nr:RICIN domain-containing protein [Streptomyces sp. SPB162]
MLAEGTYLIKNEASGLYLGVQGAAVQPRVPVVQEELTEGAARPSRRWHLKRGTAGPDSWLLQNEHSKLYLDSTADRLNNGEGIRQSALEIRPDHLQAQTWRLAEIGGGLVTVANVKSHLHLAIRGDSRESGIAAELAGVRTGDDRGSQVWRFERVPARGESRAFDALTGTVIQPGGGILGAVASTVSGVVKQALEAGGGIFETAARAIPSSSEVPYVRFDGFRGGEFIRFSQRHGIEVGPKPLIEQFPHLPKEFHDGFDAVTSAGRGSEHTHLGITGDVCVEFCEKGSSDLLPVSFRVPVDLLPADGDARWGDLTPAGDNGRLMVSLGERKWLVDRRRDPDEISEVRPFLLEHLPQEFRDRLDAVASATIGTETHYFLALDDRFSVVSESRLVQGTTRITDAYPLLEGVWM